MSEAQENEIAGLGRAQVGGGRAASRVLLTLAILNAVCAAGLAVSLWQWPAASAGGGGPTETTKLAPDFDYEPWVAWPVQDGRTRPFGTFCDDTLRQITGKEGRFRGARATPIVLSWMLGGDWGAAEEKGQGSNSRWDADRWEETPFILCDYRPLRAALSAAAKETGGEELAEGPAENNVSPAELRRSKEFDRLLGNVARARSEFGNKAHFHLSTVELKAEEVSRRLLVYDALRGEPLTRLAGNAISSGRYLDLAEAAAAADQSLDGFVAAERKRLKGASDPLHVVALDHAAGAGWLSLAEIITTRNDEAAWRKLLAGRAAAQPQLYSGSLRKQPLPSDEIDEVLQAAAELRAAYRGMDTEQFAAATTRFHATLADVSNRTLAGSSQAGYPGATTIGWELLLSRVRPFRWAWVMLLASVALVWAGSVSGKRGFYWAGLAVQAGGLLMQLFGFALRIAISGFAPVSNMYESVIFAAFMAGLFGLVLEAIYGRMVLAAAGGAAAAMGLILADQLPLALDPKLSPMTPVLRTNYWLTVHVLTIVASYAAATLAWALGNVSLGLAALGRDPRGTLKMLAELTYRAMQLAVLLLAAGTLLGGWWASQSWGRFWGWDPKEVGALIALVCYVIPLHARYLGWVRDFGLAVSAVLCYGAILLSWYVINFVLATGLHSYGFASGGGSWVGLAVLVNMQWVLFAANRYLCRTENETTG